MQDQRRRMGGPFLVGAAVVLIVFGAFYLAMSFTGGPASTAQQPLPFGPAEQQYTSNIKFENLNLSGFENMLHQKVTYLSGDISNKGARTIRAAEITVEFYDSFNKVALRDTRRIIGDNTRPLESGETQDFQIGFEDIPNTWNHQFPAMRITGLALEQ